MNDQREPRYTPYHIRHRTEVAGFMTILHGDDRIHNNIFVQQYPADESKTPQDADYLTVGTAPFDIFPSYEEWISHFMMGTEPDMGALAKYHFGHLPVWVSGNAYFNGATVSAHEKKPFLDKEHTVSVQLAPDGSCKINNDLWSYLKDFETGIITSDTLGCAFEPEQRFENPDGTDLALDRDYFGNHRGLRTIPGPFADVESAGKMLW